MTHDEDLGLSDREKELKKWNAPYRYQEFPKMLFRGTTSTSGRIEVEQRVVDGPGEEAAACAIGWALNPKRAQEIETTAQEAVGIAAAERAYADRRMSAAAQADADAADGATARHLGAVPERPRRPSRTKPPE